MINESHILPPPSTPPPRAPKRSEQLVGAQFATPKKRRPPRKDNVVVSRPDAALRQALLEKELRELKEPQPTGVHPSEELPDEDVEMADAHSPPRSIDDKLDHDFPMHSSDLPADTANTVPPRRTQPDEESTKLYGSWLALIPSLLPAYLDYMKAAQGRMGQSCSPQPKFLCRSGKCEIKESAILCLHFDCECSIAHHYWYIDAALCQILCLCRSSTVLVLA